LKAQIPLAVVSKVVNAYAIIISVLFIMFAGPSLAWTVINTIQISRKWPVASDSVT